MSSTSMLPPPSPLARRRNRLNTNIIPSETSCIPHKMSLSKGATFHSSSSPASDVDPVLSIQYLSRRSPTCSHDTLTSLLSEKRGLAAHAIADFEETFSGARGPRHSSRRRSLEAFNQQLKEVRAALPTDEGLGSSISSPSEKGISKSLARVELDSGLGDSIDGSVIVDGAFVQRTSEDDNPVIRTLMQDTDFSDNTNIQTTQQGRGLRQRAAPRPRSSESQRSQNTNTHPSLSRFAKKKISENLFNPLLKEERFAPFRPFVSHLGSRVNKNIRCLRDLERSLIFQPVVSSLYPLEESGSNASPKTQISHLTPRLYQSFGEFTIQLVVDTYNHLSETEQRRSTDRSYTSGYFLDLVEQVTRLAAHIGESSRTQDAGEPSDGEVYSIEDEVTLEGGLGDTGDFAELVRWRNGKGISLRTGLPYEPLQGLKRQHSTMSEEEIARSMARRKKGYIPEIIEMQCSDPDCDKIFTRKCDLAKHEKTHSRPFKCPYKNCKYHELGLPTEKEKDRHMNDKHDPNPRLYPCLFCEFKTKRESNCKQHMEKKHNWEYKRAKGKDKDSGATPSATPHTQTMDYSPAIVQQSPAQSLQNWDDHSSLSGSVMDSNQGSTHFTPVDMPISDFGAFNGGFSAMPLFPREQPMQGAQFVQPSPHFGFENQQAVAYDQFGYLSPPKTTPETAPVRMTPATPAYSPFTPSGQSPFVENMNFGHGMPTNVFCPQDGLPTPESGAYPYPSRHASIQYDSPITMDHMTTNNNFMLGQDIQIPQDDFALNFNAFSNPAAADQVLFDEKDLSSQQFDVSAFHNADFDIMDDLEMDDLDEYVDFNGH